MSNTLDDFFGDGLEESAPECSFCGGKDDELIVSIQDAYGPTHWHHAACQAQDDATKGKTLIPTWDEATNIIKAPAGLGAGDLAHWQKRASDLLGGQPIILTA